MDRTTPSLGARRMTQQSSASSASPSGRASVASARSSEPSDIATRDCAAATAASATARPWATVSICVTVATPRVISVWVRSNCSRAKASSSSARRRSERATSSAARASATRRLGLRAGAGVQKRGAHRFDHGDHGLPETTLSPTATGARRAVPAMGLATS
jgi:hypothetical protein